MQSLFVGEHFIQCALIGGQLAYKTVYEAALPRLRIANYGLVHVLIPVTMARMLAFCEHYTRAVPRLMYSHCRKRVRGHALHLALSHLRFGIVRGFACKTNNY